MGKYTLVHDGKCHDYRYKQLQSFHFAFYTGDILQGQVFNMGRAGWSAVPKTPSRYGPYDGFKTRMDAAQMILKVNGYHLECCSNKTPISIAEEAADMIEEFRKNTCQVNLADLTVLAKKVRALSGLPDVDDIIRKNKALQNEK